MTEPLQQIIVTVPCLETACRDYRLLLGLGGDATVSQFGLANAVIRLEQGSAANASVAGLALVSEAAAVGTVSLEDTGGPQLQLMQREYAAASRASIAVADCSSLAVDHVVLRTRHAQACIDRYRDRLGIRLALDKTVPEWGGRMLFFRPGGFTLEVIASDAAPEQDDFWGIAYRCSDINVQAEHFAAAGVQLSNIRAGRKPGTRVATLKSHDLGIPTLLIEHSAR
jgi:catechol 2,3-dioxygenase-like lactoylglutathione lyase family enzyme